MKRNRRKAEGDRMRCNLNAYFEKSDVTENTIRENTFKNKTVNKMETCKFTDQIDEFLEIQNNPHLTNSKLNIEPNKQIYISNSEDAHERSYLCQVWKQEIGMKLFKIIISYFLLDIYLIRQIVYFHKFFFLRVSLI